MSRMPRIGKATKELGLLFAVPLFILLVIAGFTFIPRLMTHPKYDFIYVECSYSCDNYEYHIDKNNQFQLDSDISMLNNETLSGRSNPVKIGLQATSYTYKYYDIANDSSRDIPLSDLRDLSLDGSSRSPDGYTIERSSDYQPSGLFWNNSSSADWVIKNGYRQKSLSISSGDVYDYNFKLIGWVIK